MQYRKSAIAVVAALAATLAVATPASAAWRGGGWHGRGLGLGFAAGAIAGSALAAPYYYGGYGYGYGPYAYDDGYDEAYAAAPGYGGDQDDQSCAQRYKSYDPSSGTYLGYDGARHPCP
jgi:BA14K-like protein